MNKILAIDLKIGETLTQLENKEIDFEIFHRTIAKLEIEKLEIKERGDKQ